MANTRAAVVIEVIQGPCTVGSKRRKDGNEEA